MESNSCNLILIYKLTIKELLKISLVCIIQTKHTFSNIVYGTIIDFQLQLLLMVI